MSKGIVKIEDFKIENVKLSEIKLNKKGSKVVYINYDYEDGSQPKKLMIQLPKLKVPFGISGWDASKTKEEQKTISIASNDLMEISLGEKEDILKKLEAIENLVVAFASKNSKDLLGKKYKEDVVKEFYSPCVKQSFDKEGKVMPYPPRLKCKLSKDDKGEYLTKFFDSSKKKLRLTIDNQAEYLPKMSDCLSIVGCSNVWVVGNKFGVTFRPEQVKIYKNESALEDYAFGDDDEDDEAQEVANDLQELVLESVQEETTEETDDLDA